MKKICLNKNFFGRLILPILLLCLSGFFVLFASAEDVTPSVPINPPKIVSISLSSPPEKTVYEVGEALDLSGAMITLHYSTGASTTTTVKSDWCEGFDSSTSGTKTVVITYPGVESTASFDVVVKSESGIEITSKPGKLKYFIGDSESRDGLVVSLLYSDGSSKVISEGFTVSGFSSDTVGEKTITVSYKSFSASYKVEVIKPALDSIIITKEPAKTSYYEGDAFSSDGLVVSAKYENGTEAIVSDKVTLEGYSSSIGTHTITVSYSEDGITKSASFTVKVSEIVPTSIEIATLPSKLIYTEGEELSAAGLTVKVIHNNGSEQIISQGFELEGFSSSSIGEKTVTVKYLIFETEFKVNVIISAGHVHNESEFVQTKAPSCTEPGIEQTVCTICHEIVTVREIAPTGHSTSDWQTVSAPTCTADGSERRVCTVCSEVLEERAIVSPGHTPGEWTAVTLPTCTEDGLERTVCLICTQTVEERVVPALGHTPGEWEDIVAPSCTEKGSQRTVCTVCGAEAEQREVDALGHSYGDWTITAQPSCTVDGSRERCCTVCADGKEVETIRALGHNFSEWKTTLEPTALAEGTVERVCSICTFTERNSVPKLVSRLEKDGFSAELSGDGEVFPYLTVFAPSVITDSTGADALAPYRPSGDGYTVLELYELSLKTGEATYTTDGRINFVIPFEAETEYDYYIVTTASGVQINATLENGRLSFSSTEGGSFAVVGYTQPTVDTTTEDAPQDETVGGNIGDNGDTTDSSGDNTVKIVLLIAACVVLVGVLIAVVYMYIIRKYY